MIQQDGKGDIIKVLCFERCCGSAIRIGLNANTDPDPTFYLNADPDPGSQTNTDPDPDPGQTIKSQKVAYHKNI